MNSLTLKQNGFADFVPLKGIPFSCLPFNKASVIVMVDDTLTGKPTPDILYIGRSKKPAKRIFGGYLAGYGGKTTRKISSKLLEEGYIEKVSISWMFSENPKEAQQELLEIFKKEHGEYPAWNIPSKAAKKPQPPKKAVKAHATRKPATPKSANPVT